MSHHDRRATFVPHRIRHAPSVPSVPAAPAPRSAWRELLSLYFLADPRISMIANHTRQLEMLQTHELIQQQLHPK